MRVFLPFSPVGRVCATVSSTMFRKPALFVACAFSVAAALACNTGAREKATAESAPSASATYATQVQKLGQATPAGTPEVALATVARSPKEYLGKTIVTKGTVGSVCQHMGCWMTLSDDNGEAFIRMAGHAFMVPKDSKGKKARVLAKLVDSSEGEAKPASTSSCAGGGSKDHCKEEAEKQNGKPLAKLELEALGVEIF